MTVSPTAAPNPPPAPAAGYSLRTVSPASVCPCAAAAPSHRPAGGHRSQDSVPFLAREVDADGGGGGGEGSGEWEACRRSDVRSRARAPGSRPTSDGQQQGEEVPSGTSFRGEDRRAVQEGGACSSPAPASSTAPPSPLCRHIPSAYCPSACPWKAASLYHRTASTGS